MEPKQFPFPPGKHCIPKNRGSWVFEGDSVGATWSKYFVYDVLESLVEAIAGRKGTCLPHTAFARDITHLSCPGSHRLGTEDHLGESRERRKTIPPNLTGRCNLRVESFSGV